MSGIVMLVGRDRVSNIVYHALSQSFAVEAVIREAKAPLGEFLRRRVKKLGIATVAGQVCFKAMVLPVLAWQSTGRAKQILADAGLNDSEIPKSVVTEVPSVNSDKTISELRRLAPRVVVVNGTRIIQEKVLQTVDAVFLNVHAGITPMYRGVHGGYWALASGDPENFGVTVHKVDRGIDTGCIVAQATARPTKFDNFVTYPLLQTATAIPLLTEAVRDVLSGTLAVVPARPGKSRLWSHPTAWQYIKARIQMGAL